MRNVSIFSGLRDLENQKWQLSYETDAAGQKISGSKSDLITAVLSGAYVRIGIGNNYFTAAQNVHIHGKNDTVSAELLNHVSKASWNTMKKKAYWYFVIVDTNGIRRMTSKENNCSDNCY